MTVESSGKQAEPHATIILVAAGLLVLLLLIIAFRYRPPRAQPVDAAKDSFSSRRALASLERILGDQQPHPLGSPANEQVRGRLVAELRGLGYEPVPHDTLAVSKRYGVAAHVRNVLARLEGKVAGDAVLLVAHYDSVEAGPGAGDDGSGVATLLEIARALKAGPQPNRTVIFLFSDGEEAGLLGAEAFVAEHEWLDEVGVVINIEARGSRGPSLMFETGPNDAELVERFFRVAGRPIGSSTFPEIYSRMPNNTDFTPFREKGLSGLNVSFIGGVEHYHTALDDLDHLDARSVQHNGDNLLPLVRSLSEEPLSGAKGDAVYFDVLALTSVRWPKALTPLLAGVAMLLIVVTIAIPARGDRRGPVLRAFGWGLGSWLVGLATAIGVVWLLLSRLVDHPLPWLAEPGAPLTLVTASSMACLALVSSGLAQRSGFWGAWGGVWLGWSALGLGLSLSLPGASHHFLVPALVAGVAGLPAAIKPRSVVLASLAGLLPAVAAGALCLPAVLLMYDALGIARAPWLPSGYAPTGYVIALFLTCLSPLIALRNPTRHRSAVIFVSIGLTLVAGVATLNAKGYTADPRRVEGEEPWEGRPYHKDVPRRVSYFFVQDLDQGDANWLLVTPGEDLPEMFLSAPQRFSSEPRQFAEWIPLDAFVADARPLPQAKGPELVDVSSGEGQGTRKIKAMLRSGRQAPYCAIVLPGDVPAPALKVGGKEAAFSKRKKGGAWMFWCYTVPLEGIEVEITLEGSGPVEAILLDADIELPPSAKLLKELRHPHASPSGHWADLWIHVRKQKL